MQRLKDVKNTVKNKLGKVTFDMLTGVPLITQIGNHKVIIENYKNVLEFMESSITLSTSLGVIHIEGEKMTMKEMTSETLIIEGKITKFELI